METKNTVKSPDFLVVGVGKTGTSWLRVCLQEHPEVFVPGKEIHFFSKYYDKGFSWYEQFFRVAKDGMVIGDISPSYMFSPVATERIYDWKPTVKIIFSLRNPIDRAYSHYKMGYRFGRVTGDIDNELSFDTQMVRQGLYAEHVKRYLTIYSKSLVKIVVYDDLKQDPERYLRDVFSFLAVDEKFSPSILQKGFHVTKGKPKYPEMHRVLLRILKRMTHTNNLTRAWVTSLRKGSLARFYNRINPGTLPPRLSEEKLCELANFYQKDVEELSILLDRDMTYWVKPYLS